jgi:hypothetical protein
LNKRRFCSIEPHALPGARRLTGIVDVIQFVVGTTLLFRFQLVVRLAWVYHHIFHRNQYRRRVTRVLLIWSNTLGIRINGLDDLRRRLAALQHRAQRLSGTHNVEFSELFCSEFMLFNTDFESMEAMFAASGFTVRSQEDFASIPDDKWDAFVQQRTRFQSWNEMLGRATQEYVKSRF